MSDTPQNDSVDSEIVEQLEPVTNDSAVDSETTTPVEGESEQQVDEVEVAKKKANDAFNRQYGEKKQLERDLAKVKEQNFKFEQAERERQQALVSDIPPVPDAFDDDYDAKIKQRDEAIVAQANYQASNNAYLQQQQFQQQNEAQAQQVKVQESIASYSKRATELGIKQDELQSAANIVAGYGLSDDLVMHILNDSDGALITKHLAANPQDGYELATIGYTPNAGAFLDNIKQKAGALKPKTSNAPNPATNLSGNGVDPDKSKGYYVSGAKYD